MRPTKITSFPASIRSLLVSLVPRHTTLANIDLSSLRSKYTWPEAGLLTLPSSPFTLTYSNSVSNVFHIDWDRVVTVNSGMFSFVIAFRSQLIFISLYNDSYEYHDRKGLERE